MTISISISSLARRLRLQSMYVFFEVTKRKSILAASKELHMSQPAVTKAIQDLEKHLEQPLFIRTSQGVSLTEFGMMFEKHVKVFMTDLRHLNDDLTSWGTGVSGRVVLGTMLTASADFLPRAIMRLKDFAPNVTVEIKVGVNEKLYPDLSQGELDLVVGLLPATSTYPELEHCFLYNETLCAVVGRQNELASVLSNDWSSQDSLHWIIPPTATAAGLAARHFFELLNIRPPTQVIESVSIMTNIGILMESDFIALMPYSVARRFVQLGLLIILPVADEITLGQIGYTFTKNRNLSPATQRFIDALRYVCQHHTKP